MPVQSTLILLKPDCVQRGLVAEVLGRFEHKGLRIVGMKLMVPSRDVAGKHYAEQLDRRQPRVLVGALTVRLRALG